MHPIVARVTARIRRRSAAARARYLERCRHRRAQGPNRNRLACSNFAHAIAGCGAADKQVLRFGNGGNIAIVSAYNDLLSAHQPYHDYPQRLREEIAALGCSAQFAGGVPAMCDGITQGGAGMELSLFSRDVIALATAVALSHDVFDGALLLGICDKIVPGLLIGALSFGHLPALFVPAGPMPSGLPNAEKARLRQEHAAGRLGDDALLEIETRSYHSPGTCTFYGTANSNQVLLECMGLMLPGAAFVNPDTALRDALTRHAARQITRITALAPDYRPLGEIVDERAIVNALVGLLATGGSSNHTIHWVAVARAAGIVIDWDDIAALAGVTPLLARIYPNGQADINDFHAAGGSAAVIRELLRGGLLHADVLTILGPGLEPFTRVPALMQSDLVWQEPPEPRPEAAVIRPLRAPFAADGGLRILDGNLGRAVIKASAVAPEQRLVEAPARVFQNQDDFGAAFARGELERDVVVVLRYQGPRANGMPELHKLIPRLGLLQDRGFRVALVTDGRLSGASGKVPAAIHVTPEAAAGGALARVRDGDVIRLDADGNRLILQVADSELAARSPQPPAAADDDCGRDLFAPFRARAGSAEQGASLWSDALENVP